MSGLFGSPKVPKPAPPPPMPDPNERLAMERRRMGMAAQNQDRSGRMSTMLSDRGGTERLGG